MSRFKELQKQYGKKGLWITFLIIFPIKGFLFLLKPFILLNDYLIDVMEDYSFNILNGKYKK